jgi:hypothetical protein
LKIHEHQLAAWKSIKRLGGGLRDYNLMAGQFQNQSPHFKLTGIVFHHQDARH